MELESSGATQCVMTSRTMVSHSANQSRTDARALASPVIVFARRTLIAIAVNLIIAIGLSFLWLMLRSFVPPVQWVIVDYAIWLVASVAHVWYYESESRPFKIIATCFSLAANAWLMWSLAMVVIGGVDF